MKRKILVPKYVQYIMLPLLLFFAFWFMNTVRTIILLFLLAFIIAFVLDQPVTLMHKHLRIPRLLGVILIWLVVLGVSAGLLALVVPNVISELNFLIEQLPGYSEKVKNISNDLQEWFIRLDLPYKPDITAQDIGGRLESAGTEVAKRALDIAKALFGIGLNAALVWIISIYMLLDADRLKEAARNRVPAAFRDDAINLFGKVQHALGSYLRGQLFVSTVMGILGGIIAWYGGSGTYVFIIAVWVAITEVIPLIGPFLGAAPAVALAYFVVSPQRALIVFLLFIAVQQLEGHILVPKVMGKSVGVHPLWVMFAVLSGGVIAGILGTLVALPLVAIIKTVYDFYREELVLEKWDRPLLEKTIVQEGESA